MIDRKADRTFDESFKQQVVKMIREQNLSIPQVCRDMDLIDTAVRRWVEQYDAESAGLAGIYKPQTEEQRRIRQLGAKVRQLRHDNDILKNGHRTRRTVPLKRNTCRPKLRRASGSGR